MTSQNAPQNTYWHTSAVDLLSLLEEANIPYRESGKNVGLNWIGINCPFCQDTSFHMGINKASKKVSCFRCGTTGTLMKVLKTMYSFQDALAFLNKHKTLALTDTLQIPTQTVHKVEFPKNTKPYLDTAHRIYLKEKRNFDPCKLEEQYNLHSTGPISDMPNRIIVPIVHNYRLISYTSISIADKTHARYKHCPDSASVVPVKHYLYNLDSVRDTAYLTEGIFDTWRLGNQTVCSFGVKLTQEQVRLLTKIQRVCIVFDGDKAGRDSAQSLADILSPFTQVRIFYLPDGKDPDILTMEEILAIKGVASIKEN